MKKKSRLQKNIEKMNALESKVNSVNWRIAATSYNNLQLGAVGLDTSTLFNPTKSLGILSAHTQNMFSIAESTTWLGSHLSRIDSLVQASTSLNFPIYDDFNFNKINELDWIVQSASTKLNHFQELGNSIQSNQFIQNQVNLIDTAQFDMLSKLTSNIDFVKSFMYETYYINENFELNEDGSITIGDDEFSQEEIHDEVSEIFSETIDKPNFDQLFWKRIENIKEKRPTLYRLVVYTISIMITVVSTYHLTARYKAFYDNQPVSPDYVLVSRQICKAQPPNKILRDVIYSLRNDPFMGKDILSEYQVVKCETLNVRVHPSMKSQVLGTLKVGYMVRIVERHKKWTLVEYLSKDESIKIQGYVFNKFLIQIKNY